MNQQKQLQHLFASQKLSVLATQSDGQPHGSLVAFAASQDLKCLVFATDRNTSKYRNIISSPRVAMLADNRSNKESDFKEAYAVTAKGAARELMETERNEWTQVYTLKHPNLEHFTRDPNVALILIEVEVYLIAGFDSTTVFKP